MNSIFLFSLIFLGVLISFSASSRERPRCPQKQNYSQSQKKCICDDMCSPSPNIIQNATTCKCSCKEILNCKNYQWWDSKRCQCSCYIEPLCCKAPLVWSESTCDCECPLTTSCSARQVVFKPDCTCGCLDVGAKDFCLKQGSQYNWSDTNCSCSSSFGDNVSNLPFGIGSALIALGNGSVNLSDPIEIGNSLLNSFVGDSYNSSDPVNSILGVIVGETFNASDPVNSTLKALVGENFNASDPVNSTLKVIFGENFNASDPASILSSTAVKNFSDSVIQSVTDFISSEFVNSTVQNISEAFNQTINDFLAIESVNSTMQQIFDGAAQMSQLISEFDLGSMVDFLTNIIPPGTTINDFVTFISEIDFGALFQSLFPSSETTTAAP